MKLQGSISVALAQFTNQVKTKLTCTGSCIPPKLAAGGLQVKRQVHAAATQ